MSSDENLLSQRTVWGINPQVVETLIADHGREIVSYRSRLADMEARINVVSSQHDEALRRTSSEHTVAHSQVAELESRLSSALAQAKASEDELTMLRESADRINMLREEAVQVVADAWAMAQAIEERAQQLVQRTRTELMNEATKMRAQFEDERTRHQAEMERLGKQRVQMLMQLEATARGLLDHATLIKGGEAVPGLTSTLDLALRTLNPDSAASETAYGAPPPSVMPPPAPMPAPVQPIQPAQPPPSQSVAAQATRAVPPEPPEEDATQDASLLSSALDELEALLSQPKDRWQNRKTSASNGGRPGDDLLRRLRKT